MMAIQTPMESLQLEKIALDRKESSEIGSCGSASVQACAGSVAAANSNGTLNMSNDSGNPNGFSGHSLEKDNAPDGNAINPCLQSFKACCKRQANFGLEDIFWLLFLLLLIIFAIIKLTNKIAWTQWFYMLLGSILFLILLYIFAAAFNKFILEDSSTAHWNAHARFTQAAIQERIREEEQRVHVIAPPKMGGAKLNIIYTVGDVPLARSVDTSLLRSSARHSSSGSLGMNPAGGNNSLSGGSATTTGTPTLPTLALASAALLAPTALNAALAPSSQSQSPPAEMSTIVATNNSTAQNVSSCTVASSSSSTTVHTPSSQASLLASSSTSTSQRQQLLPQSAQGKHRTSTSSTSTATTTTKAVVNTGLESIIDMSESSASSSSTTSSISSTASTNKTIAISPHQQQSQLLHHTQQPQSLIITNDSGGGGGGVGGGGTVAVTIGSAVEPIEEEGSDFDGRAESP